MSMNNSLRPSSSRTTTSDNLNNDETYNDENDDEFRDIHALTPPLPLPPNRRGAWDSVSVRSSNLSVASDVTNNSSENFTTMSREFNALVLAGSGLHRNETHDGWNGNGNNANNNLDRIGEEEGEVVDTNPLAIVPDSNPLPSPRDGNGDGNRNGMSLGVMMGSSGNSSSNGNSNVNNNIGSEIAVHRVKKEEVETKIMAWQTAKVAKINNRFKRDDAIISGWENEQVHKASSWMKRVERKLEEKRAKAMEKMQNDIAKAHRKAEERRASAEGKRGTKAAKVLEIANLMRAVGKPPTKRSFF